MPGRPQGGGWGGVELGWAEVGRERGKCNPGRESWHRHR